ncbi:LLM class flavin-dependent oxidoreductase [Sciscionella sediminilitoris]|uniref:LLM class flavin-dependent oxidoreductase n=1 Tax=Sciscionella sediminilitoris TaxID=1445613 RepID=UPI000AFF759B|nr:LLM class flavin-dependent oxidoreductase [Sciscionella sp. SE31]
MPIEFHLLTRGMAVTELAKRCEGEGYRALVVGDHPGLTASPFVTLAAAATATSTLRLGTSVLNAGIREPLLLASDVATLDRISAGRAELGLGAGHTPAEWEMLGRTRPAPAERIAHLLRVAGQTSALLAGETITETGAVLPEPRPVQDRIPLLLGGGNPALLRWAGAHADAVGLAGLGHTLPDGHRHTAPWSLAQLRRHTGLVRAGAGEAQPPVLEALVQHLEITEDAETALHRLGEQVSVAPRDLRAVPYALVGTVAQIAEELHGYAERFGITRFVLREESREAGSRILAALNRA